MSREALEKILGSRHFAAAQKQSAFLRWVVEKALQGRSEEIKEYSIAVEVYGRKPDYDPQANSAVRVDASRLRARLKTYYENEGRYDAIRIELPRGSYVPVFVDAAPPEPATPPEALAPSAAEPAPDPSPRPRRSTLRIALSGAAAAIAALALLWWWNGNQNRTLPVNAIAVLPFVSLSAAPEDDAFCDGVTEEVTAALARVEGLKVPSRTVMAQHKGKSVDLRRLASELGVQAFLEGSLRREGNRYLFTAQLIEARQGFHIWAETYDRSSASRLDMQREVASSMASAVAAHARGRQTSRQAARPPSAEAMNAYVRAVDLLRTDPRTTGWSRGVPKEHQKAIDLLTRATKTDPQFGAAWSTLAEAHLIASQYDRSARPAMIQNAKTAARRAIELDPSLGDAWGTLGDIAFYVEWKLGEAERALSRSVELQPRNPRSQQEYADLLRVTGRRQEAGVELNRAIALAPSDPSLRVQRALHLYDDGRFPECRAEASQTLQLRPNYTMAIWLRGLCFQAERQWADAEREFRSALAIAPADGRALPALAHLYAQTGRRSEAAALIARMRELAGQGRPIHYSLALVHAGSGSTAAAIQELELAYKDRDPSLLYMTVERRFMNIAQDPGFENLARRLGLRR